MRQIISADPLQTLLLPPCVEDWVGPEHPARFIREFVGLLDLRQLGLDELKREEGGVAYAPEMLVGVWLYGYFRKIRSLRGLELACAEEMGFVWLTGHTRPDHHALWRYWHRHRQGLRALFKHSVKLAIEMGLVGFAEQALDGTKIQARASAYGSYDKAHLQKRLAKLDEQIAELERELAQAGEQSSVQLPGSLHSKQRLREKMQQAWQQIEQDGDKHVHPQEPTAMRMKTDKGMKFGHNAQAIVDAAAGVVVSAAIADEPSDQHQLCPQIEAARELRRELDAMIGPRPSVLTKADAGYASIAQLAEAQAQNQPVMTPPPTGWKDLSNPYHPVHFQHDRERKVVVCPQGRSLPLRGTKRRHGCQYQSYQSTRVCADCPVRSACTDNQRGREVLISEHHPLVLAASERWQDPHYRQAYQRRTKIIEPLFAQIKQQMRFRRWSFFGKENVSAQWLMLCATHNLKRIFAHWRPGQLPSLAPLPTSA